MSIARVVAGVLLAGLMTAGAGLVRGQDFPAKPIRILTGAPGGSGDITARLFMQPLSEKFGQPLGIENRPITEIGRAHV